MCGMECAKYLMNGDRTHFPYVPEMPEWHASIAPAGINLWEVVGVTKKSIDSTLKGISQTINALHDGYEKGLEAVGNVLAKIRGVQ